MSTSRTVTVGGLINGTRYHFRVAAKNRVGVGAWSRSASAIPATRPAAPRSLTATNADRAVRLSWLAPGSNGGSAITDYVIQRSPNGSSSWLTINDGVRSTTGYTVSGLTNGTRYYFRVFAKNVVGQSPASNTASAVLRTEPGAVEYFEVYADDLGFYLYWGDPVSTGGSPITSFVLQAYDFDTSSWLTVSDAVDPSWRDGFIDAPGYGCGTFRIAARNAVGVGPYTRAS